MAPAPSPATTRSSRKRASSVCSSESSSSFSSSETTPATKKRATGTKVSDKVAKKELRMERNRIAAQASRDRKRVHQESLESKIEHLERQLAQALSGSATSSPSRGRSITPADSQHLADENTTLRSELETERRQSAALKGRLGALEAKFLRLEGLLASPSSSTSGAPPVAHTSLPTTSPSLLLSTVPSPSFIPLPFSLALDNLPELPRVESTVPDPAASSNHGLATDAMDVLGLAKDESFLPAAEVVETVSLDRASFTSVHASPSAQGQPKPELARDLVGDFDSAASSPLAVDGATLNRAWTNWAASLDPVASLAGSNDLVDFDAWLNANAVEDDATSTELSAHPLSPSSLPDEFIGQAQSDDMFSYVVDQNEAQLSAVY